MAYPYAGPAALYGLALVGLALWLALFDIARRTIAARGLARYMAVALLAGYAWLAVAGVGWIGLSLGQPMRDLALHALGLGFVFSMMLAHAPLILPALARVKLHFGAFFYLPLGLLHASLAWRLVAGATDFGRFVDGAVGNGLAIAVFAATLAGSALPWRLKHPSGA